MSERAPLRRVVSTAPVRISPDSSEMLEDVLDCGHTWFPWLSDYRPAARRRCRGCAQEEERP